MLATRMSVEDEEDVQAEVAAMEAEIVRISSISMWFQSNIHLLAFRMLQESRSFPQSRRRSSAGIQSAKTWALPTSKVRCRCMSVFIRLL